ncbi:MAG: hypothetical protein FWE27_03730, partial [Defluviitaleaceae bacterium]|nr:hypothetical protein [Defluviitaleaceae bacterium]
SDITDGEMTVDFLLDGEYMQAIYVNVERYEQFEVGSVVKKAEVIARMRKHSNALGDNRTILEIEIHHDGQPIDPAPLFDLSGISMDTDFLSQPMVNFFALNAGTNDITCPHRRYAENLDLEDDEMYLRKWIENLAHSENMEDIDEILQWNSEDSTITVFIDDEVYLFIAPGMCEDEAYANHFKRLGINNPNGIEPMGFSAASAFGGFDDFFIEPFPINDDETCSTHPGMPFLIEIIEIRNSRAVVALHADHDIDLSMYDGYRFSSPDEAAIVFASRYNRPSIHLGREFGAVIFRVQISSGIFGSIVDTFYSYGSEWGIGKVDAGNVATFENDYSLTVNPSNLPTSPRNHRFDVVADIHTHGPFSYYHYTSFRGDAQLPRLKSPGFSVSDIDAAKSRANRFWETFRYIYVVDNCGTLFKATSLRNWNDEHVLLGGFYVCPLRKYQHQSGASIPLNLTDHPLHWYWNLFPATPWNPDILLNDINSYLYYFIENNLPPLQ